MKVAFLVRHFTPRGSEIAIYDYAFYNQTLLKNTSYILHYTKEVCTKNDLPWVDEVYQKFSSQFTMLPITRFDQIVPLMKQHGIRVFYQLKAGHKEESDIFGHVNDPDIHSIFHCMFSVSEKQGTIYTPISDAINKKHKTNYPVLPHIAHVAE